MLFFKPSAAISQAWRNRTVCRTGVSALAEIPWNVTDFHQGLHLGSGRGSHAQDSARTEDSNARGACLTRLARQPAAAACPPQRCQLPRGGSGSGIPAWHVTLCFQRFQVVGTSIIWRCSLPWVSLARNIMGMASVGVNQEPEARLRWVVMMMWWQAQSGRGGVSAASFAAAVQQPCGNHAAAFCRTCC
jgi:hypothetical protein